MVEFDLLMSIVEEISGIERDIIISKNRSRPLVELRMICSNILKKNHKITVEKVGQLMNIDHSTVTYHMKTHKNLLLQKDGKYKKIYENINNQYQIAIISSGANIKESLKDKKEKLEVMLKAVDSAIANIESIEGRKLNSVI